ncbi:MAG: putative amino acid-binding protein [Thermoleophilia bacterium]|nr:putative amino acid-binding protein [Thermoleophilia bacterium]
MNQFAIAAMGGDQPGIVAAVGEALLNLGGNIDDSSMTILGGQFAMLLVVNVDRDRDSLDAALRPVAERFGLKLEVSDAEPHPFSDQDRDDYVVAAYGPDRGGLVSTLSRVLADVHANINDFGSRLGADSTFAMWFNVSLADDTNLEQLRGQLDAAGRELGLDVRLYQAEAEEL